MSDKDKTYATDVFALMTPSIVWEAVPTNFFILPSLPKSFPMPFFIFEDE